MKTQLKGCKWETVILKKKLRRELFQKMWGSAQGGKGQTWKWRSISFHRTVKKTHYQVQGPQLSPRERCMLLNVNHVNLCLMRRCTTSQATYATVHNSFSRNLQHRKPRAPETQVDRYYFQILSNLEAIITGGKSARVNSRFHGQCWRMEVFLSHGLQCQDQGLLTGVRWHITSTKP